MFVVFCGSSGGQFVHTVAKFTLWLFVDRAESLGAAAQQQPGRPQKKKAMTMKSRCFRGEGDLFCFSLETARDHI